MTGTTIVKIVRLFFKPDVLTYAMAALVTCTTVILSENGNMVKKFMLVCNYLIVSMIISTMRAI